MYGLDTGADLSALSGGMLTFVGFGQYQLQLAFTGAESCLISVEGDYRVSHPPDQPVTYTDAVGGATALLPLLGRTVASAAVLEGGTVRVTFDDASLIDVLDSSSEYESYQMNLGDCLIIV